MYKRRIYDRMLEWKNRSQGKTALLIEGARRVGKSTIVKAFAESEYETHIIIDFSMASREIRELFDDVSDLNYLFLQLQLQFGVRLVERRSLIVFDEVQLCPHARQAIKHLVADGRYDYVETGSLISIRRNTADILIPSEEEKLQMRPMDFEEFRWAQQDTSTTVLLREAFERKMPLGDQVNRTLMRDFRLYMLVGGMPQAVEAYLQTNNLQAVDDVKRGIISLYEEDFYKISPSGALSKLFDAIPSQLANKSSRYHVSSVIPTLRAATVQDELSELVESKTVLMARHVNDPNVGMSATVDIAKFKLYLADTGLFVTLAFKDDEFTDNVIYRQLLADKLPVNLGMVYENVVAQELAARGHGLFYHTWAKEGANRNYEVDFVLSRGRKVMPVEVKSSRYSSHPSLDALQEKYASRVGERYLIYTRDMRKDGAVTCIPTYMTFCL